MRRRSPLAVFAAMLLLPAAVFVLLPWWWIQAPEGKPVLVNIPAGASVTLASRRLEDAGVIDSPGQFRLLARLFGGDTPIQAGVYRFRQNEDWGAIYRRLQRGDVVTARLTIPEGLPSVLVAERLRANGALTGPAALPREGSVLPDTYQFAQGTTRAAALAHMQRAMDRTLVELWKARKPTTAVKTPAEAVVLASIVEKETAVPTEHRLVAAVYSNRLRRGMKLEADPTVIYPITAGKPLGRRIRQSELDADNGYNTYARAGLPKGPITNPGRASLAAVLDPAPGDALFMVADGSGGHAFAATLAEHEANVRKWYAIRRARGEM